MNRYVTTVSFCERSRTLPCLVRRSRQWIPSVRPFWPFVNFRKVSVLLAPRRLPRRRRERGTRPRPLAGLARARRRTSAVKVRFENPERGRGTAARRQGGSPFALWGEKACDAEQRASSAAPRSTRRIPWLCLVTSSVEGATHNPRPSVRVLDPSFSWNEGRSMYRQRAGATANGQGGRGIGSLPSRTRNIR